MGGRSSASWDGAGKGKRRRSRRGGCCIATWMINWGSLVLIHSSATKTAAAEIKGGGLSRKIASSPSAERSKKKSSIIEDLPHIIKPQIDSLDETID
ncbi:hypothetical protein Cni_G21678 [Canna indica]|uniref:Uncharacterized protein n=1 Tax=Canna indica TaxID=4628 RepID=A0AAQ3KQE8_9LILI|nr:hypothetical protein Cni_G21678 [Canna indica]